MTDLPRFEYDPEADVVYVYPAEQEYSHGRDLDAERRIDYAADGTPIGVELTCVRSGVNVEGLPSAQGISRILNHLQVPILARRP